LSPQTTTLKFQTLQLPLDVSKNSSTPIVCSNALAVVLKHEMNPFPLKKIGGAIRNVAVLDATTIWTLALS